MESRWWYWIAAYPVVGLLFIPLAIIVGVLLMVLLVALDAGTSASAPSAVALIVVFVGGLLVLAFFLLGLAIFVVLPVALYFDAAAVEEAPVDWDPDPFVYALLAAMQFFVTPVIGFVVAVYYLYRRHTAVGVP